MCFSVRKIKSATCWQHLAPNYLCAAFPSDAVRFWLIIQSNTFIWRFRRNPFLEFHLLCTWVNESHLPSGEMSGNLQHFLFVKGQHLFPKITAWRCPFMYACAYCWMLNCSEPPRWFPSNRTLCSVGFRFSQVIFCFWTLSWAAFICRLSPNTSLRLSQNFCQRSPPLLWLQVTSFSLNATSLEPTPEGLQYHRFLITHL